MEDEEWGELPTVTESTLLSRYIDVLNVYVQQKNLRNLNWNINCRLKIL